ncbi:MAG: alpha-amylase [Chloroflexi bacterium]|nr:alpha-amylase [Chloroflexota bacterium]
MPLTTDEARSVLQGARPYFPSPSDWRDHWIYFLLVDRFNNADGTAPKQGWNSACAIYQGGTFAGVQSQLGYLRSLGAGALWLSPVIKNPLYWQKSYHGYGAQDFLAINPYFSSDVARAKADPSFVEDEFRALVDACHRNRLFVIVDVVLRHTGDLFAYRGQPTDPPPWRDSPEYDVMWRDSATGNADPDWPDIRGVTDPEAGVWPVELRTNEAFVRKGNAFYIGTDGQQQTANIQGDFWDLKSLVVNSADKFSDTVLDVIILAYQYLIAKYDIDGMRIDSLKYVDRVFAQRFANAIREYALTIGKQNFLTFGEVTDNDDAIARFVGRVATDPEGFYGVDSALDFPLRDTLVHAVKLLCGQCPSDVARVFACRHKAEEGVISSHGEASGFFVTFLDNHDNSSRFGYLGIDAGDPWRDQVKLALTALFTLPGIPCVYYGTEQSLQGNAPPSPPPHLADSEYVREALWGKPGDPFDLSSQMASLIRELSDVRAREPALRYGRQYFRQTASSGTATFAVSTAVGGPMAYSRILAATEVLVVCNLSNTRPWTGDVVIDASLNQAGATPLAWSSNLGEFTFPNSIQKRCAGSITIDGNLTSADTRTLTVALQPMEAQIIRLTPPPGQLLV